MQRTLIAILAVLSFPALASAQPCGRGLQLVQIPGFGQPQVAVAAHPSDSRVAFTLSLQGQLTLVRDGVRNPTPSLSLTASGLAFGDSAGYGLACDPDFARNGHIYVFGPSLATTQRTSRVVRFTRSVSDPNLFDPTSAVTIIEIPAAPTEHTGGWIGLSTDGLLFIGLGDHFLPTHSQDTTNWLGKLLRIDPRTDAFPQDSMRHYAVPASNPVATSPFLPEVVAVGLRNPFRCGFDTLSGDLYIGDVGATRHEEVSVFPANATSVLNFGWPCREGLAISSPPCRLGDPLTNPLLSLSRAESTCIVGGQIYRGAAIPWLVGRYVFASCASSRGTISSFDPSSPRDTLRNHGSLATTYCLVADSAGELIVGTINGFGFVRDATDDCNTNGLSDSCDISTLSETDFNRNGRPDSCERLCRGDWNLSGNLDQGDLHGFVEDWFQGIPATDMDGSGRSGLSDLFDFLNAWFLCG